MLNSWSLSFSMVNGTQRQYNRCRGWRANRIDVVGFIPHSRWHHMALEKVGQIRGCGLGAGARPVLQRPRVLGFLNNAKIVDDGVELAGVPRLNEAGRGDARQQTNDRDHDHDFHEREAAFATGSNVHNVIYFY